MAQGGMVYKATVDISDIDRNYYGHHVLTVARHPAETEARLMLRIVAFCRHADEHTEFGRGLSTEGEPALWHIDDTGAIKEWIEVGCSEVKQVRRAAGRSEKVIVEAYDEDRYEPWWKAHVGDFSKIDKLDVYGIKKAQIDELVTLVERNMRLSVTVQDDIVWLSNGIKNVEITFFPLKVAEWFRML